MINNLRPWWPRWLWAVLLGSCVLTTARAGQDLFVSQISIDGAPTFRRSVNDIREWESLFDDASLGEIFPGYLPTSSVVADINLRGLQARLSFDANATTLRFEVPALGIDLTFDGATRGEARDRLVDWLESGQAPSLPSAKKSLERLLRGVVRYSPVDPVAGNPNSLQTTMFQADYLRLVEGPFLKLNDLPPDTPVIDNQFHFRASYDGAFTAGPHNVQGVTLDFGGTINLEDRRWAVLLGWPMTVTWTEGSESLMAAPGAGFKYRVNEYWDLAFLVRGGVAGSLKLGALAVLYAGNLGSYVRIPLDDDLTLGWAVLGGFNQSLNDIEIDDYNLRYNLHSYPLRTGLDLSGRLPLRLFHQPTRWGVYAVYTHFFGTELYMVDMAEVGFQLALVHDRGDLWYDRVRLDAGYVVGEQYDGASLRLTWTF